MAATSPITAVMGLIDSLSAAAFPGGSRPDVYLDEVPVYDGGQLRPPWLVLGDYVETPQWDAEANAYVTATFTLTAYYRLQGDADLALDAVLWNGAAPNLKGGLAFATLSLTAPRYGTPLSVQPGRTTRGYAGFPDFEGKRVHKAGVDLSLAHTIRGTG